MTQSNIVTLQLSDYNSTNVQRMAQLSYSGNDILDDQTKVWVNKFILNTQAYPLYVPNLSTTWNPYFLNGTNSNNTNAPPVDPITVKLGGNSYITAPIQWLKTSAKVPLPVTMDSEYFWVKSAAFLCEIVTSAFDLISPNSFVFIKQASNWCLATSKQFMDQYNNDVTIYFNDAMRKYFNFNYQDDTGFKIKTYVSTTISGNEYYTNSTDSTNNLLFPFDRLVFVSSNLPVQPLFYQESANSVQTLTKNVILSYTLNITDISMLGNSITFDTNNADRSSMLTGYDKVNLEAFTISVYLAQRDDTLFQVRLKSGDKISLEMLFY